MISLACDGCGAVLRVADAMAGKKGKCQKCGAVLTVPDAPDPVPAASPPTPVGKGTPAANPGTATVAALVAGLSSPSGWTAAKTFGVLKWVAVGLSFLVLLMVFLETESAPRQAVLAAVACVFGIAARIMQAEQQFRGAPPRPGIIA